MDDFKSQMKGEGMKRMSLLTLRENNGWRVQRPVSPLGYLNFTKVIFRPIKRLKLIRSWFLERSANLYSVLSRENSTSPLQISAALRQSRVDLTWS